MGLLLQMYQERNTIKYAEKHSYMVSQKENDRIP